MSGLRGLVGLVGWFDHTTDCSCRCSRKMSEKSVAQLDEAQLMLLQEQDLVWIGAQKPAYSLYYKRFAATSLAR
jgi:hypothetical protein